MVAMNTNIKNLESKLNDIIVIPNNS